MAPPDTNNVAARERAKHASKAALAWYAEDHLPGLGGSVTSSVDCFDPSVGKPLWSIPNCGADIVERSVGKARETQRSWQNMLPAERARLLNACADALDQNKSLLAEVLALETGKSLTQECEAEVNLPAAIFRYFGSRD